MIQAGVVQLFHRCVYMWLGFYALALLGAGDAVWAAQPVPLFTGASGFGTAVNGLLAMPGTRGCQLSCLVLIFLCVLQWNRPTRWVGVAAWLLFRFVDHRMWLAANGGTQLMGNMLLWAALMRAGDNGPLTSVAFWIARLQLVLVYAVTVAHKFIGHAWLDGSAVLTVARDPDFNLSWLTSMPLLCTVLTYVLLTFMALFPLAVWWAPSRRVFLLVGALFHLSTALFMDIPQMGLAFIACYMIWLKEDDILLLSARWGRFRAGFT